jgi:hypothetical protein
LIVEAGDGPFIPALPAFLLIRKLTIGDPSPGARPCLGEFSLEDIESTLTRLSAHAYRSESIEPTLYEQILGSEYHRLPYAIRRLHDIHDREEYHGEATVVVGRSWLSRACVRFMRLPREVDRVSLHVIIERTENGERWTRRFGAHEFSSRLKRPRDFEPGVIIERFGMLSFRLALVASKSGLSMPIESAYVFGLRLPYWLTPTSSTYEKIDETGRFRFDVDVALPWVGRIVRYVGWLVPSDEESGLKARRNGKACASPHLI